MRLTAGNAQHIGQRQQQQDSFGFSKHAGILAVVADGMGGMANGEEASRAAVKAFLHAYEAKTEPEPIPDALLRSILAANAAVFQLALEMGAAEEMGTTLVATVIDNDQLYWVSSGDSAIFLYREGEFTLINQHHIFAVELDEQAHRGSITKEVARAHPEREALTAFLGMEQLALVDRNLRPFALREKDVLLLASDGLFKTLSFDEMAAAMEGDAQTLAQALVNRTIATAKQYQDNVTVLAIIADSEQAPVAAAPESGPPAPAKQRSRLVLALLAAAVAAACGYLLWMLSNNPARRTPQSDPKQQEEKK